jgi:alcohol dehydrogenase
VAGVVSKTGSKVSRFKVGDEVYARAADFHIGAFAEYVSIDENDAALKPKNLSMVEAASIPLVGLTAWQALVVKARLQNGQKIFIQAGSGGVGTIAIQLARNLGATVATTTGSAGTQLVKDLGANVIIDYRKEDFETLLKDYDVVLNSQDNKTLEKSLQILKPDGKLISISGPPTPGFAKELGMPWYVKLATWLLSRKVRTLAKKKKVDYSFLFMTANGKQLAQLTALIENGEISPVIDKVFPFEQTNEALQYVEGGRAKGKVVIQIK